MLEQLISPDDPRGVMVLRGGVDCIFVLYPASPDIFAKFFPALGPRQGTLDPNKFLYVGRYSAGVLGVQTAIVTIPKFPGDLTRDELLVLMGKIRDLAAAVGARGVALAGILAGLFYRFGIPVEPPCVSGNLGTVYAVVQTLRDAMQIRRVELQRAPIRILGYGFVGQRCLAYLQQLGCVDLAVVEKRLRGTYRRQGVIFTNSQNAIRENDWVVFVAGGGDQVDVSELPRVFGINDMYPPFSAVQMTTLKERGSTLLEVAMHAEGVVSDVKLEQFFQDQFPGCLAQGLVQATGVDTSVMSQTEFDPVAQRCGIRSSLM